jgi:hypothetical protein
MHQQPDIVIKTSPIIFLKRLIFIELLWALLTTWLSLQFNFGQVYEALQLRRIASFSIIVALIVTSLQILFVAIAFVTWYFDTYRVDRRKITHQRGNFFGVSDVALTQALTDVKVRQSRLGRTFNYGNLELVNVDLARQTYLKNIPNPRHYADLIKELITPQQLDVNLQLGKSIPATIAEGEGQYVEFKSSFSWDYRQQRVNKDLNKAVMKNVVAFMNTTGGVILIGVDDEGEILGLEPEFETMKKPNPDGFENLFNMAFNKMVGVQFSDYVSVDFESIEGKIVCRILTLPASEPVYLTYSNKEEFYIRTGNSSQPLAISQAVNYIQRHFDN